MSDIQYYEDSSRWGEYQYTTLNEIINNYLGNRDSDDYTSTTPRHKVLYQAMRGVRELYYDVINNIRGFEIEIKPTLTVVLPPDYVSYVRVSILKPNGEIIPLAIDKTLPIADSYLQDHQYKLLFDDEGYVLSGTIYNGFENQEERRSNRQYTLCGDSFAPNRDNSKIYTNGSFNVDKNEGLIRFSSDVEGKSVILEYISDGLYTNGKDRTEDNIKVHKFAESALIDYIYYELIKQRRNVPANEKERARREYYNSRRIAKRRLNRFTKEEFLQMVKGSNKWIK